MKFYEDDLAKVYNSRCEEIIKSIPDESIDCIITDPPYGIGYKSNKPREGGQFYEIEGDEQADFGILTELYRVLRQDSAFYCFTRWDVMEEWRKSIETAGFVVRNVLVWDKGGFSMGDLGGDWATCYESIIYAVKGDHKLNPPRRSSVIKVQKILPSKMVHPNEKPIGVWYPMISSSTRIGDIILDPYAGSCSSILAARQLRRKSIGVELDLDKLKRIENRLNQIPML